MSPKKNKAKKWPDFSKGQNVSLIERPNITDRSVCTSTLVIVYFFGCSSKFIKVV
jgi:hypothetical protein